MKLPALFKFKLTVELDLTASLKLPRRLSWIHTSLVLKALLFTLVTLPLVFVAVLLTPVALLLALLAVTQLPSLSWHPPNTELLTHPKT